MKKILLLGLLYIITQSCATPVPRQDGVSTLSESDYEDIFMKKTHQVETYSGFMNALTFSVTTIDTEMIDATLARSAQIYEWNANKFLEENNKAKLNVNSKSEFFISVYTPERSHNDLSSSKSIWKVYLDVNNQRYEGTVTKVKGQLVDIQSLYPSHNRFSTPYKVEFLVPVSAIEKQTKTFTVTGPKASAKVTFD